MKYIKNFEDKNIKILKDYWRGDVLINHQTNDLYLVVDDVFESDKIVRIFSVGHFGITSNHKRYVTLNINRESRSIKIDNKGHYYLLDKEALYIFYNRIYYYTGESYLNIIYNATKINIKDTLQYKEFLIEKEAEKYNL